VLHAWDIMQQRIKDKKIKKMALIGRIPLVPSRERKE